MEFRDVDSTMGEALEEDVEEMVTIGQVSTPMGLTLYSSVHQSPWARLQS